MIGIAVLINAILLPILAHLGVFKAMHGPHLESVKLVELPPEKKPPMPKKTPKKTPPRKRAAPPHPAAKTASHQAATRPSRPNPNQPKLVVGAGGSGSGPGVENNGTGAAGQMPSGPPPAANSTPPANPSPAPGVTPSSVTPPPVTVVPTPPPGAPVVTPSPSPPPHVPVVVAAEPLSQPHPQIPDDLSADNVHDDFKAVFTIGADGDVSVRMTSSTGNPTLDALALDAARRWTFRPATVDGKPVSSFRRFVIQFEPT